MDCSTSGFPVLHYLLEFAQFRVYWISDAIQVSHPSRPLLLLPSTFPSIRVFSNVLTLRVSWLKYWSFSNSPSSEYSGLISFRIDWFDLLVVQETLKSLLQHHNSKASILWCCFLDGPALTYMTTGKTIPLTICTIVSKILSLLFNMLFRFVMAFFSRSKHLQAASNGSVISA